MHRVQQLLRRSPLTTFFTLSLGLGWVLTWLLMAMPSNPVILPLLALPISYVPAGVAWLLVRWTDDAARQKAFQQRLWHWRVGWRWLLIAVLVLPLIHLVGVGLATGWGGQFPFHPQMIVLYLLFLPVNLGEEIGWRGYALPRLQEHSAPITAGLIIGLVWGAFHLVALLANPDQPWRYLAVGWALMLAMSLLMTWLFNQTQGSVPLMALTHAMYDTVSIAVAPLIETGAPLLAFALSAGVAWVVIFVWLALGRLRRTQDLADFLASPTAPSHDNHLEAIAQRTDSTH
ncbi:MAG: type II CAAX endopeptidase family protein [Caldilineaceae bacterium]